MVAAHAAVLLVSAAAVILADRAPTLKLNDDHEIPALALGTARGTSKNRDDPEEVRQAVEWALEAGYRHVDTAESYDTEEPVGQAIANKIKDGAVKREDLFVTTKVWNDHHRKEQVVPALRASLARLGLDYVDLYLVHFPVAVTKDGQTLDIDYLETWKGMEEARQLGLTRSIGVSNFNEQQLQRVMDNGVVKPSVLQVEVNPTLTQHNLVKFAKDHGVVVMAYSPFGFLVSARANSNSPPPRLDDLQLTEIANKYNKSTPQIVLRYLVDRVVVPIPKSTNKERIAQNIDIFDFKLTAEEVAAVDRFNKNQRVISVPQWQNHPYYPFEKTTS